MNLRGNKIKTKLQAGEIATIIGGHNNSTGTIDFFGPLGFDGFWLEGEHGTVTWDQIDDLARACDLWGMTSVLRVYSDEPWVITRALDRGVNAIVIPHVNTKAQAEAIVRSAKFGPIGRRGIYPSRRSYGVPDYFERANDETMIIVLIEEIRAVENLAEILTVDHIDAFFVAAGDLSQTMGYVMQIEHPKVIEVVDRAIRQIVDAGRVAGALAQNDAMLERNVRNGARLLLYNYDRWLRKGAEDCLSRLTALSSSRTI
jgi:4-hydroxy-2-oxoheptanedioate aldolase